VGLGNLNPGCNCCGCLAFADDFSSGDALTVDYTGDTGSFTKSGGVVTTTSANVKLIAISTGVAVQASFKSTAADDKVRLIVAYKDTDNYVIIEWRIKGTFPVGSLSLIERVAGIETTLLTRSFSVGINVTRFIRACHDASLSLVSAGITNTATNLAVTELVAQVTPTSGIGAGFGTGGTVTGTVTIDDFRIYTPTDGDTECPICRTCSGCSEDPLDQPDQLSVVIDGLTPAGLDVCTQANCDSMEGTYVVNRIRQDDQAQTCFWEATFTSGLPTCGSLVVTSVVVRVHMSSITSQAIIVWMTITTDDAKQSRIVWVKSNANAPYDCDSLSSVEVPFLIVQLDGHACGLSSSSTATVSAV